MSEVVEVQGCVRLQRSQARQISQQSTTVRRNSTIPDEKDYYYLNVTKVWPEVTVVAIQSDTTIQHTRNNFAEHSLVIHQMK